MSEFNVGTTTKKINANIYPIGPQGPKGDTGEKGEQGYFYTPFVSEDGILSWINNGELPNPPSVNIKGEKGDKGETGATGPSNIEKIKMLSQQMPWNTTSGESIHIQDASEWDENKLSLSGNMKQEKRSGKNVLNLNKLEVYKNTNNSYSINGTNSITVTSKSDKSYLNTAFKLKLEDGTYIFNLGKVQNSNSSMTFKRMTLSAYINGTRTAIQHIDVGQSYNITITNEDNKLYVLEFWGSYNTVLLNTAIFSDIYIAKESTFSGYEQYGAMPSTEFPSMPLVATGVQKIKQFGNNLLNIQNGTYSSNGVTATVSNGKVTLNGTATGTSFIAIPFKYKFDNAIVSLSANNESTVGNEDNYAALRIEGDINTMAKFSSKNVNKTFNWNGKIENITIRTGGGLTYNNFVIYPQLEYGQPTPYKPCTEEINTLNLGSTELCAIVDTNGNVVAQDRPVYRNVDGVWKWQWEKKIKKLVLNGTETWNKSGNTDNVSYWTNTGIDDIDTNTISSTTNRNIVASAISNYFEIVSLNEIFTDIPGLAFDIVVGNGNIEMRIGFGLNTEITTVNLLKEWLAQKYAEGNPIIIYYILATPTYTNCTAQQSAVLDKLYNNFKLQKGTNNIIVETDNGVGVNMQLDYMQDNNLVREKEHKNFDDRITVLENLLSTTATSAMLLDNMQIDLESEVE